MRDWTRVRELWTRVFVLGWPIATEQLSRTLMRTTDMLIMALISPAAVVAVGLGDLWTQFTLRVGLGLGGGAIALASQDTGRSDVETRNESIGQALLLGFLVGIPFVAIGISFGDSMIAVLGAEEVVVQLGGVYLAIVFATAPVRHVGMIGARALQGTGDTRSPMAINVFANLVNIVLSAVLGLGLLGFQQLGVVGVGIATAIGNLLMAVLSMAVIVHPRSSAGISRPRNLTITRQLLVVSIPRFAEGMAVGLIRFPFNAILLGYGTAVNAGYHIGRRVFQQVTSPLQRSLRTVASIIVGQDIGEGEVSRARFDGWWLTAFGALVVGSIGFGVAWAADPLVQFFGDEPTSLAYGADFIRAYGIAAVAFVTYSGLSGALQGASETRTPFLARLAGAVVFMLGFTYVVGTYLGHGPVAAYGGILLSYLCMAGIVIWNYRQGQWMSRARVMMEERAQLTD